MTTNIITVKSILSRPLNEPLGVLNLEQCNGLERRQYGLEGTHVLSKSIALSNIRLLPGPPHPPIIMVYRYGMGETGRVVRLGSGPGGRCIITSCPETDMNVVKDVNSGFVVPNILQTLKKVYGEDLIRGVYNYTGTEPKRENMVREKPVDEGGSMHHRRTVDILT